MWLYQTCGQWEEADEVLGDDSDGETGDGGEDEQGNQEEEWGRDDRNNDETGNITEEFTEWATESEDFVE